MEFYIEVKFMGDTYGANYGNGLSMCGSQSVQGFSRQKDDGESEVWVDNRNHKIVVHKKKVRDAIEITTEFFNESDTPVTLEMISSFAAKEIAADKIHRMQSFWSVEGKLRTETIEDLHLEPSWTRHALRVEKFGNLGSMPIRKYFPFLVLEDSKAKKFVGFQLYSPSSWQMEILCRESEKLSVTGGIVDFDFGHWCKEIKSGEKFTAPRAMMAEGESLYEVCDKLVKAQRPNVSEIDRDMGIVFNEYCTTWGNPTFENVKKIADKLKGEGIQYLVIDSGWYGTADEWWRAIGDWDINKKRFPDGLKVAADYIRSCGMIPGIWFEFETLSPLCSHYDDTEHLLKRNGVPLTVGEKRFWDMEDSWVKNYLSEKVIGLLKDCGFGYLKVDYNDTIGVGCDCNDSAYGVGGSSDNGGDSVCEGDCVSGNAVGSLGEGLRRKVLATQGFFKKIKDEIPDIVIENCSSGGHRLEPSMMELCSQASFSDAHETKAIPLIAANLQRVIPPYQSQIWAVLREKDDDKRLFYTLCSTFLGRMCLSGDIYDLSESQWKIVRDAMEFYKNAAEVIRGGMTVKCECTTKSYNNPTGSQLVIRTLRDISLAVFHRFENSEMPDKSFLEGKEILGHFGNAGGDFSAESWLYRKG